jgi:hypothetical protein
MPRHRIAREIAVIIVNGRRLWWPAALAGGGRAGGKQRPVTVGPCYQGAQPMT